MEKTKWDCSTASLELLILRKLPSVEEATKPVPAWFLQGVWSNYVVASAIGRNEKTKNALKKQLEEL